MFVKFDLLSRRKLRKVKMTTSDTVGELLSSLAQQQLPSTYNMKLSISFLVLAAYLCQIQATELENVSDDDLVHIIKRHSFAVVLFCEYEDIGWPTGITLKSSCSEEEL